MAIISIINDEVSDNINEVVTFLKKNRLNHVEVRSFNKNNIANIDFGKLKKYASYFKKNNIKISCIASPILKWNYKNSAFSISERNLENSHYYVSTDNSYKKIFEIADIFDAKYIRIFSFLKYAEFNIKDLKIAISELILLAEKYDKILLIENEPICNINNTKHLKTFISYFKHERIKILFDLGNIYKQGDVLDYDELSEIKNQIKYIHIKDYSFEKKEYVILGEGDINYKKFISWIEKEKNGEIFYSLETHVPLVQRSVGSTKSVIKLRELLMKKRVKYGIVGCGRIFKKHLLAIKECPNAELVGVFDINKKKRLLAARNFDCKNYSRLDDLISEVDVVNICTPHYTHAKIIDQVLKKNKYCLCEKPGSISSTDMATVKKNTNYKNKLFVVYQNRYNKTIVKLNDLVGTGKLGKILYIFGGVRWFRPKDYYQKSSWQGHRDKEGGILFNQGIHIIDIIMNLLPVDKKILFINSVKDKIYHNEINTEDIFITQFKVGKTLINLEVTVSSLPDNLDSNLFIIFEKGRAIVGGKSLEAFLKVDALNDKESFHQKLPLNKDIYGLAHQELITHLTKYVQTGYKNKNLVNYDQACTRIDLINHLYNLANK